MDVIKELCAFLPRVNPRGVWGQYEMRDYLSVDHWEQTERVMNEEHEGYIDFIVNSKRFYTMPGKFIVRTNWEADKVKGIYVGTIEGKISEEQTSKIALLFDLTFTPDMALRLAGDKPSMAYPDAGSW